MITVRERMENKNRLRTQKCIYNFTIGMWYFYKKLMFIPDAQFSSFYLQRCIQRAKQLNNNFNNINITITQCEIAPGKFHN